MCRSLFMGGVFRRFPGLRFAFLEGGVGWACQLFSDLVGRFEKRKWDEVVKFDPREFDLDLARELLAAFSEGRMASQAERYLAAAALAKKPEQRDRPFGVDDWAEAQDARHRRPDRRDLP